MISRTLGRMLNSECDIEASQPTQDSTGGEVESPWIAVETRVACCIQPASTRRRAASQRQDGRVVSHTAWMRPREGYRLGLGYRLKHKGRYLHVLNAVDNQERGLLLTIDCEEQPE